MAAAPSHAEFANLLLDRLARAGEEYRPEYDGQQFCLRRPAAADSAAAADFSSVQYLAKWYESYSQAGDDQQREAILAQFVDLWLATRQRALSGRAADIRRMLPLVRSRWHHELTRLRLAISDPEQAAEIADQLAYRVFAGHLAVSVGEEFRHSYRQLTRSDLEELGMRFDDALTAAQANLLRNDPNFAGGVQFELVDGMFWCSARELSGNNSAALLFTDNIRNLPVRGEHVAFVPHNQIVWITGSANSEALRLLSELTLQDFREHPAPISALPFILEDDQWRPWLPAATHPAYAAMKMLHVQNASAAYDEQAELLEQQHSAQDVDVHLAVYRPLEVTEDDGRVDFYSVAIWTDSVATLLPKTDVVVMQRLLNREALDRGTASKPEFGERLCVPWERFEAHLGSQLRRQEVHPERYLVDMTLEESSWAALAGGQHRFATVLLAGLAARKPAAAIQPRSRVGWWIAGGVLGCAGLVVVLFFMH